MSPTKRCYTCKEIKPRDAEHFNRDRSKPDGLHSKCKSCERVWTREIYRPKAGRPDAEKAKAKRRAAKQQAEQ